MAPGLATTTAATPAGQCSEETARALTVALRQSLTTSWDLLVEAYQRRAWAALGYESWDAYTDAELGETRLRLPREQRREVVASMTEAGMSTRAIGSALGVDPMTVSRDRSAGVAKATPDEPIDAEIVDDYADLASGTDEQFEAAIQEARDDGDLSRDHLAEKIARELAASDDSYAEQAATPAPTSVLGTDGKTYNVAPKPAAQRRRPLTESFWQAAYDLSKVTERIARLADDDRFPQNAEQVATANRSDLLRAIDALQGVVNRLPSA
ncbi:MAG TPA: helix-turn-helix domain-containing protein [Acidimicrobiales bacterium]|nr:helix-turn-helix domain-containing protein [Acidimicrobiales bacterium]